MMHKASNIHYFWNTDIRKIHCFSNQLYFSLNLNGEWTEWHYSGVCRIAQGVVNSNFHNILPQKINHVIWALWIPKIPALMGIKKEISNNLAIRSLNINSLKNRIVNLRDVLRKPNTAAYLELHQTSTMTLFVKIGNEF